MCKQNIVDLGTAVLDINDLDLAQLERNGESWVVKIYMKTGNIYEVSPDVLVQLKPHCVQTWLSDKTNLEDIASKCNQ